MSNKNVDIYSLKFSVVRKNIKIISFGLRENLNSFFYLYFEEWPRFADGNMENLKYNILLHIY